MLGRNDAPLEQGSSAGGLEDGTISGKLVATDVDDDAVLTYRFNGDVPIGLTMDAKGNWNLDTGAKISQDLHAGKTMDLVANYVVTDEYGASSTAQLKITVTGTADKYAANGSVSALYEKTAVNANNGKDIAQAFSFDLHTEDGAFNLSNGLLTVKVTGDIDGSNETANVVDVTANNGTDFTNFSFSGLTPSGQEGADPDSSVVRSGSASVSAAALQDSHVDFTVTLSDKIGSHNHTMVEGTPTYSYEYWA